MIREEDDAAAAVAVDKKINECYCLSKQKK